jgi:ABC-type transporter Mla subunit MlaD
MRIDHYHHFPERDQDLVRIEAKLDRILERMGTVTPQLERLTREVAETKNVTESVVTLIGGLAQQIRDNANDAAALTALADELDANEQRLTGAVTENTPAPTPTPTPDENPPV